MPGCGSRVQYQGGSGDVGQFWFRERCHCGRASGLRIGFGALLTNTSTAGSEEAVYAVQVRANCCPGGTNFNISEGVFGITGPNSNEEYALAYDTNNAVVLAGSNAGLLPFDPSTFNAGSGAYIEAITGCPNALRLRTVGV